MAVTLLGTEEHLTPRCSLRLSNPMPGVLITSCSGHLDMVLLEHILRFSTAVYAGQRPVRVFHDWWGLTGYDPEARSRYTTWSIPLMKDTACVHILTSSRVVAMGVTVANLVLKTLTSHTRREEWEAALASNGVTRKDVPAALTL